MVIHHLAGDEGVHRMAMGRCGQHEVMQSKICTFPDILEQFAIVPFSSAMTSRRLGAVLVVSARLHLLRAAGLANGCRVHACIVTLALMLPCLHKNCSTWIG
jgi:hypothetical protein